MTQPAIDTVVLVGHCGADTGSLTWFLEEALKLPVEAVNSSQSLQPWLEKPGVLLLVNRILEGSFPTDSGVELIAAFGKMNVAARSMLISNYPEAQSAAVKFGALPGFGKSQIGDGALAARLQALVTP